MYLTIDTKYCVWGTHLNVVNAVSEYFYPVKRDTFKGSSKREKDHFGLLAYEYVTITIDPCNLVINSLKAQSENARWVYYYSMLVDK